jgi:hypothetical protein
MISKGSDKTMGIPLVATPPRRVFNARVMNEKIMITLPWMKMTQPQTAYSVMRLIDNRRDSIQLNFGDAFVVHTRNRCADLFLKSKCDWMLTIDDDMVVPFGSAGWFNAHTGFGLKEPFASTHALERLLSHKKTLVGALYFGRQKHGAPMYNEGANVPVEAAYARKAPYDEIRATRWVGTGCMLIHRTVYEDIEKKFPNLARYGGREGQWFTSTEHNLMADIERLSKKLGNGPMDGEKALMAFSAVEEALAKARANSNLGMGEDVAFCVRAGQAGHQPYVDMGCLCGHIGSVVFGPSNTYPKTPHTA